MIKIAGEVIQELKKRRMKNSYSVVLEIGGTAVKVNVDNESLYNACLKKYRKFLTLKKEEAQIYIFSLKESDSDIISHIDQYREITHYVEGDHEIYCRWDFMGYYHIRNVARYFILPGSFNSLDNILRLFYMLAAVKNGGFILHSSSLKNKNRGYLFFGVSGAGKTTIARMSTEQICLSDETSYVYRENGKYKVSGTPFHGELHVFENKTVPIGTMFYIKQSKQNKMVKLLPKDACPTLIRNIMFFSARWEHKQKLFSNVVDLVNEVDVCELEFQKNNKFWRLINENIL